MPLKTCIRCLQELSIDRFHYGGNSKDGRKPVCAACRRVDRVYGKVALGPVLPPDMFACSACKRSLPESSFYPSGDRRCKVRSQCKACQKAAYENRERHAPVDKQGCRKCGVVKTKSEFIVCDRNASGLHYTCKLCQKGTYLTDHHRARKRGYARALRAEVLAAYGDRCNCCGETEEAFLAVDHINGLAPGETRNRSFYHRVKNEGFPKDKYQCLCNNCNLAKFRKGTCPHEASRKWRADEWMESW